MRETQRPSLEPFINSRLHKVEMNFNPAYFKPEALIGIIARQMLSPKRDEVEIQIKKQGELLPAITSSYLQADRASIEQIRLIRDVYEAMKHADLIFIRHSLIRNDELEEARIALEEE